MEGSGRCSAAFCESVALRGSEPSQSNPTGLPAPPKGELFGIFRQVEQNLPLSGEVASRSDDGEGSLSGIPPQSLLRKASSPKGRAKSTARNFLIAPDALARDFKPWLSLRESWRGSA